MFDKICPTFASTGEERIFNPLSSHAIFLSTSVRERSRYLFWILFCTELSRFLRRLSPRSLADSGCPCGARPTARKCAPSEPLCSLLVRQYTRSARVAPGLRQSSGSLDRSCCPRAGVTTDRKCSAGSLFNATGLNSLFREETVTSPLLRARANALRCSAVSLFCMMRLSGMDSCLVTPYTSSYLKDTTVEFTLP